MGAPQARLLRRHGVEGLDQGGIERRGQADGLGKTGGVERGMAVEAFFVEKNRDAEPAVFDEEFLDGVGQFGRGLGILSPGGITGPPHLA